MLEEYFSFPIVMIDGDNEERKQQTKMRFGDLVSSEEEEYDMVFGEAEYPYWNYMGAEDRWLPNRESLEDAMNGKFNACLVRFMNVGQLLVPWTKEKFKKELLKFADEYEKARPVEEDVKPKGREIKILTLTAEQFKKATGDGNKEE